jgi:hypothetical protein
MVGVGWAARAAAVAKTVSKYLIDDGGFPAARWRTMRVSATIMASGQPLAVQIAARSATPYQPIGALA